MQQVSDVHICPQRPLFSILFCFCRAELGPIFRTFLVQITCMLFDSYCKFNFSERQYADMIVWQIWTETMLWVPIFCMLPVTASPELILQSY